MFLPPENCKLRTLTLMSAVALLFVGSVTAADTGDLKIRFEYGGDPFAPAAIKVDKDVAFCGKNPLTNEKLIVNKENKGIQNVIVYVYTGRGGSKLPKSKSESMKHTLANEKCRFEPHIVFAQKGDQLEITNPDAVPHNANLNFFNNKAVNPTIPPQASETVELKEDEPAPIPVDCNIHPWMRAYVVVLEHRFAAASDENGVLTIKGLPAGEELVFRAYHEAGRIGDVTVDGKKTEWKRARFEVDIKPGMNDLGTVVLPAGSLSAD